MGTRGGRGGGEKEEKGTPASVHCYFERTSFVHERRTLIGSVSKSVYSDKLLLVRINGLIELDCEVLQRRFRKRVSSWISRFNLLGFLHDRLAFSGVSRVLFLLALTGEKS